MWQFCEKTCPFWGPVSSRDPELKGVGLSLGDLQIGDKKVGELNHTGIPQFQEFFLLKG